MRHLVQGLCPGNVRFAKLIMVREVVVTATLLASLMMKAVNVIMSEC
jgi:hypothetical protein